ncbi:MAG TPA: WG repeat-containing protein [Isosphaeraceae bacterium]|jgi:hypothetical protein|nr:WG repeat-containing protein [Isosphaeraceae bacterium]
MRIRGGRAAGATATSRRFTRRTLGLVAIAAAVEVAVVGEDRPAAPLRLFPFQEGDRWGYIDAKGKVAIPPRYRWAEDFQDGLAGVEQDETVGFIDGRGEMVFTTPPGASIRMFSGGLVAYRAIDKYGFLDRRGKVIVEPRYDNVGQFSEGLAAVNLGAVSHGFPRPDLKEGGKWGFIDTTGKLVIPIRFDSVEYHGFSDGLARVTVGDERYDIDKAGKVAIRLDDPAAAPERRIWSASAFSEGLAPAMRSTDDPGTARWGYIDTTGRFIVAPRFDSAWDFSEGLACVGMEKKVGFIDRAGRVVIRPRFEGAQEFSEGLAAVQQGGRWSFIDTKGQVVIPGRFNDVERFVGGLARVHEGGTFEIVHDAGAYWKGGAWSYINRQGKVVHRCCQDRAGPGLDGPGYGRESR